MARIAGVFREFAMSLSAMGVILGALLFAASLTPSLVPRNASLQGMLSGLSFACGYGLGNGLRGIWRFLEFRDPPARLLPPIRLSGLAAAALIVVAALWNAAGWQNSIRAVMAMQPVEGVRPATIAVIAVVVATVVLLLARLFQAALAVIARALRRLLPPRIALGLGFVLVAWLFYQVGNGVLLHNAVRMLDATYKGIDAIVQTDVEPPANPAKTGSAASLIGWEGIGHEGRNAVSAWPDSIGIEALAGAGAMEPLRVYAGLNSAEDVVSRAQLALDELIRIGAFDREFLVIATPTGTGWVDPAGLAPVEVLARGDIASVSVQYSYLPSWLSLLVDADYGAETARAVFDAVYGYWTRLPHDQRPKLYLFGLSLGSLNSDLSADLFDVIADPLQGALWVGPPFASRTWRQVTDGRNAGTPAWLPELRDSSVIRFAAQESAIAEAGGGWGPVRIVYLQYASDPIVFFEPAALLRRPAWLAAPRGPDVAPQLRWYPVVTFLQLILDMMTATSTPVGHGHVYAARDYTDAWVAVTAPTGWDAAGIAALKSALADRGL